MLFPVVQTPTDSPYQTSAHSAEAFQELAADLLRHGQPQLALNYCYLSMQIQATAPGYKLLGDVLQRLHRAAEAETAYHNGLKLQPDWAELQANLGTLYAQQQQWLKALLCYQKALQLKPDLSQVQRNLEQVWTSINQIDKAPVGQQPANSTASLNELYSAFMLAPEQLGVQNLLKLSQMLREREQFELAERCQQQAMQLQNRRSGSLNNSVSHAVPPSVSQTAPPALAESPTLLNHAAGSDAPSHQAAIQSYNLGNTHAQQQQWPQAESAYRRALTLAPTFAIAQWHLAQVLERRNQPEAAREQYFEALSLQPDLAKPAELCKFGQMLQDQQPEQALNCYEWALQQDADCLEAHRQLAGLLDQQNQPERAIFHYQQALRLEPDAALYHALGDAYLKLSQWQEAAAAYRQAILLKPDFSWSHNNLGNALIQLEQWDEAAAAYQQAIKLNPAFYWSHYNLGEALAKLAQWDEAIAAYRAALEIESENLLAQQKLHEALYWRAKADLQKVQIFYQTAVTEHLTDPGSFHRAIDLQPQNAQLYVGLAQALSAQGQSEQAAVFYQIAAQLAPNLPLPGEVLDSGSLHKPYRAEFTIRSASYAAWLRDNAPTANDLRRMADAVPTIPHKPLISIVVPIYSPPESLLREMIESVIAQVYPHWELCLADDASPQPYVQEILQAYAERDSRIKLVLRTSNGHIAAASNSALALATGEYVALLDHDDLLTPDALYEVVQLLNRHPEADLIYSDEDKLNEQNELFDPFFKPAWCPDSFLSQNYICHLGVYRRRIVNQIGGFRLGYEGSQDYDLALRFTEKTTNIFHLPKVLYHWRSHAASVAGSSIAKPYAYEAGALALQDAMARRGEPGRVLSHPEVAGVYTLRYEVAAYCRVSIIIPTRNLGDVLNRCLESLFERSTYPDYEVIVIDNGSDDPETLALFSAWQQQQPERFRCYRLDIPFNYSRLNNYGVSQATGDYLLFLNNDTEVITPDWIEAMVEQAQRPSIGAVGAKLLYPDDTIQHAGVVLGIGGVAGHSHKNFGRNDQGYFRQLLCVSNYSAVTAACLLCRRQVYEQVGGFDETLQVAFNDVDFCLKLQQQGYRNLYLPHAVLYHYESKSRGSEDTPEKQQRFHRETMTMQLRWGELLNYDPCYSPNLTRKHENYSLNISTRLEVLSVVPAAATPDLWDFSIDLPQVGPLAEDILPIAGWAVGRRSQVHLVQVIHNQQVVHQTEMNTFRPDVEQQFPQVYGAARSGFAMVCPVSQLPHQAELTLRVVLADGSVIQLATIRLRY
ncbi:MAG: glycosyltransferase [Elainella sp.]